MGQDYSGGVQGGDAMLGGPTKVNEIPDKRADPLKASDLDGKPEKALYADIMKEFPGFPASQ